MTHITKKLPDLGFGLGLRASHYPYIFEHWPQVDWFEIISENFMDTDGRPKRNLAKIAERYPIVMHGVSLAIGNMDPLNQDYLHKLKKLIDWVKPAWVSDHLCWTGNAHQNTHDLLPIPYTEETLKHVVRRINQVQDVLGRTIALENPSTYLEFKSSSMPEAEFIARMVEESNCTLLLDINNVYVTCYNHRLDPKTYLDTLPFERVIQIHLSGHTNCGTHIIDTHDDHIVEDVWTLYRYAIQQAGRIPNTMVEWDGNIPEFPVLYAELDKAKALATEENSKLNLPNLYESRIQICDPVPLSIEQERMQKAIVLGEKFDSQPDEWITPKEQFKPADQLDVYRYAYRSRLYEVTAEDYPVLQYYLGEETFDKLLTHFINSTYSAHFNIGRFAAKLPEFLANELPEDRFALELCTLETALSQLADLPETTPLSSEHLASFTPETLMEQVLYPRCSLRLFTFDYPVNAYYCAVQEETDIPSIQPHKNALALFRHEDVMWRMELDWNEYQLLNLLFSGMTIGQAIDTLQSNSIDDEANILNDLYQWFGRWIRNGLLSYSEKGMHYSIDAAA